MKRYYTLGTAGLLVALLCFVDSCRQRQKVNRAIEAIDNVQSNILDAQKQMGQQLGL